MHVDKEQSSIMILEESVPLSQSLLWKASRRFYQDNGIGVWDQKVPYQATSNPCIAHTYAQMIVRYLQDYSRRPEYCQDEPFYILELGAGHGMFSFYVIKCLLELRKNLGMENIGFIYVITDLAEKNILWCRRHRGLQPFVRQGVLDFAQFNLEDVKPLRLVHSGTLLDEQSPTKNPMIVVANYVLDSLSQELFRLQEGQWSRGLVTLSALSSHVKDGLPTDLDAVQLDYTYEALMPVQLDAPLIGDLLAQYGQENTRGYFLVPVAALRCIDYLRLLSQGNLFFLVTDKGINRKNTWCEESDYLMGAYCSASMLVNFNVLGDFFKMHQGEVRHQPTEQSVLSSAFLIGTRFDEMLETRHAVHTYISTSGPGNVFSLCNHLLSTNSYCSMETLLAQFWASNWDPHVFNICMGSVINQLPHSSRNARNDIKDGLHRIGGNVYFLPGSPDTYFNIAMVFQCMGEFQEAVDYYHKSLEWFQETPYIWYNLGLCLNAMHNTDEALQAFRQAIELEPNFVLAKGWISQIQGL